MKGSWSTLVSYWQVTKPRTWFLLTFTGFCSAIVGFGVSGKSIDWYIVMLATLAVTLGSAGANAITCYIDRDIDAVMDRTKMRPLPAGKIRPAEKALYFGLALSTIAVGISLMLNLICFGLMLFGLIDNILIYSKWLKRRNPINIIAGGFSGGAPAMIGYSAATTENLALGLVIAALVVLWIPTHIWSLALRYKEDYAKVKVPMLPVVVPEKVAIRCIVSTSILMVMFSLVPVLMGVFRALYMMVVLIFGVAILLINFLLAIRPNAKRAWLVFKLSSPYLAVLFMSMVLDVFFPIHL
ncbi:MAG: heme o synthase [Thaumarchaeota archaeon]|jgi:protoheme IX farnesyltransferase|nr:heme o synthase [Candidatus Terraquivivens yellowstonensis]MCL7387705.1 heme o synthase [Candidatus Terraquivivens yellowstonensis]MCL7392556.1 heme o synthase [Candidatus Terraquivivens yellowstonensis]MCL7395214.1 heme o synthase [Candidatus Terraquivivens yellowstonensis]MCL7398071.1 heme o synthase [Candidatus Terraquivivens yellowstonensis]